MQQGIITVEQQEQRFSELPKDVWSIYCAPETSTAILDITKKHGLHIDQYGTISGIVGDILTGWTSAKDFIPRIVKEANTTAEVAGQVAQDISDLIFKPIRDSLKNLEAKYLGASVEEVHLSREDLLHQLENPVPIPMSGRREGVGGARSPELGALGGSDNTDDAVAAEMQRAIAAEADGGTPIAVNKPSTPKSIMEDKLNSVKVVNKTQLPTDPYREATM